MKTQAEKKVTPPQAMKDGRFITTTTGELELKTADGQPDREEPVVPHDRLSEVDTSILQEKLTCPKCGKSTLHAEFPDHYEAWIKCSSCGFFMGMNNADWHRMENSPNLNQKIKKMAEKKDLV